MGTTVTTNLSLIKPDLNESIRQNLPTFPGWASQNSTNCDILDAVFRKTTHTWAMTWQASVNPVLGTGGFIEAKYFRIFPRMLVGFFRIFVGTTGFSAGSGTYALSSPVAIDSAIGSFSNEVTVGKASFYDDSAVSTSSAFNVIYSTVGGNLFLRPPSNNVWSSTVPVTLAQSDAVSGYFMYPVSAP